MNVFLGRGLKDKGYILRTAEIEGYKLKLSEIVDDVLSCANDNSISLKDSWKTKNMISDLYIEYSLKVEFGEIKYSPEFESLVYKAHHKTYAVLKEKKDESIKTTKYIIKLSGSLVSDEKILEKIAPIRDKTIIHGAGRYITGLMEKQGLEPEFEKDGKRITNPELMKNNGIPDLVCELNQSIVEKLNRRNNVHDGIALNVLGKRISEINYSAENIHDVLHKDWKNKVIGCLGWDEENRHYLNVDADEIPAAIIESSSEENLKNMSVIYITGNKKSKGMEKKKEISKILESYRITMNIMDVREFLGGNFE